MSKFVNKVVVVTGGNSGIGLASAKEFAKQGAKVVIAGRDEKTLAEAAKEIGAGTIAVRAEVTEMADLDALFAKVKERHGAIDVLFVNAGIAKFVPFDQSDEGMYDQTMDINVKGAFFAVQKALPLMKDGGSIVLTASVVVVKGYPGTTVYSMSKAALRSLTRTLAAELLPRKIRVNAVSPGPIETAIFGRDGVSADEAKQREKSLADSVPMKRMGHADEVAKGVVFLASDDASFITGSELFVDGGLAQV